MDTIFNSLYTDYETAATFQAELHEDGADVASGNVSAAITDLNTISTNSEYSSISKNATFQGAITNLENEINQTVSYSISDSIEDNYGNWIGISLSTDASGYGANSTVTTNLLDFDAGHEFGTDNLSRANFLTAGDKILLANMLYAASYTGAGVGEGVYQPPSWLQSGQSMTLNGNPLTQNTLSNPGDQITVTFQSGVTATISVTGENNVKMSFTGPPSAFGSTKPDFSSLSNFLSNF